LRVQYNRPHISQRPDATILNVILTEKKVAIAKWADITITLRSPTILSDGELRNEKSYISGVQLKGMFRSRLEGLLRSQVNVEAARLWGAPDAAGIVVVSNAVPENEPKFELLSRIVLDRFTGSAKDSVLSRMRAFSPGAVFKGTIILLDQLTFGYM